MLSRACIATFMLSVMRMCIPIECQHSIYAQQEAVDAFAELEELKDRLDASEAARAAAERRANEGAAHCSSLEAEIQRCQSVMRAAQERHLPFACTLAGNFSACGPFVTQKKISCIVIPGSPVPISTFTFCAVLCMTWTGRAEAALMVIAQAREVEAKASADAAILARSQLETAHEALAKQLAESEAVQEALSQQLRDLQHMAIASPVKQASGKFS